MAPQWISIFCISLAMSLAVSGATASENPPQKLKVVIDPGHGGEDEGACQNQIQEKKVALNVGLELSRLLDADPAFKPLLTRRKDEFVPLDVRSQVAENEKADIFISIHANSSLVKQARGTEFYFENQNATDEESLFLANRENNIKSPKNKEGSDANDLKNILSDLAHSNHMVLSSQLSQQLLESFQKDLNIKTRAIRQAPFHVLSVTMPATLIELGFISNPTEAHWLSQSKTQRAMARAIYNGLKTFKEKLDKIHSHP